MKNTRWMIALGLVAVAVAAPFAKADMNITNNGVVWTYTYEGNVLPENDTPTWTHNFENTSSVTNSILTVSSTVPLGNEYRMMGGTGLAWDPTGIGSTFELRLKVDSAEPGSDGAIAGGLALSTGGRGWYLGFSTNNVVYDILTGEWLVTDTTAAFHIYRLVISDETNGPLTLYKDNSPTPLKAYTGVSASSRQLDFGDNHGGHGGQMQWDYVRWTNEEATSPIPEPTAGLLAAMGVMLLFRMRHARRK